MTKVPTSILFIGNSLTISNDLPGMLVGLARAGGYPEPEVASELVGGRTLEEHWQQGVALARLRSRGWDLVVLQDLSTQTYTEPDSFAVYGRTFIEAIQAHGAHPVLYETWAWHQQLEDQVAITRAYEALGASTGATVVPAGQVWERWRRQHGEDGLFTDNRHPQCAGTYLTACAFYATLYGADPAGLPGDAAQVDKVRVQAMQRTAWSVVAGRPARRQARDACSVRARDPIGACPSA